LAIENGKPEGKRPLRRPRYKWEVIITMDLMDKEWKCVLRLSGSGQGPVAGGCEHGNEPLGSLKGEEFLDYLNDH
jgi:hypothetical protein